MSLRSAAAAVVLATLGLTPAASASTNSVNCGAGGHLQGRINSASPGSTILVKGTCKGPFHITGKGLTLKGDPTATLDGQRAGSTLTVDALGKSVRLSHLIVTGGKATEGGGIHEIAGHVVLTGTTVRGNLATAPNYAFGGGIRAEDSLSLVNSLVVDNQSKIGPQSSFGNVFGGGISSDSNLTLNHSIVRGNSARVVSTNHYVDAYGGGIESNGPTTLIDSSVLGNRSVASSGPDFANSFGGGIEAEDSLKLTRSAVSGNRTIATSNASSTQAEGGGIRQGLAVIELGASTIGRNVARATSANNDATASGGGIDSHGKVTARNSTISENTVEGDAANSMTYIGFANGGGVASDTIVITAGTVAGNQVLGTGVNLTRRGGGLDANSALTLRASIVAANKAAMAPDCSGPATSQGYNLIGHKAGCMPAPKKSDRVGVAPRLGPLQDNGGPTETMAIASTSPALNAIRLSACAVHVDQRGIHRPQGPRCDIGAYELKIT